MSTFISDLELIELIAKGDSDAFEIFYHRFKGLVYSRAYTRLGNNELAEEVMQEVFLNMWLKAYTYDPTRASLASWVSHIAMNATYDKYRDQLRQERNDRLFVEHFPNGDEIYPDPCEEVSQKEGLAILLELLSVLPKLWKDILILFYVEDLGAKEVGAAMQLNRDQVYRLSYLARKELRPMLEKNGISSKR